MDGKYNVFTWRTSVDASEFWLTICHKPYLALFLPRWLFSFVTECPRFMAIHYILLMDVELEDVGGCYSVT